MQNVWPWLQQNGVAMLVAIYAFVLAAQHVVDLFPNHQQADTWFGKVLRGLETLRSIFAPRPTHGLMVRRPKSIAKTADGKIVTALVIALTLCIPGLARGQAAPIVSTGPSLSLLEIRTGYTHPVQVAPGLGYQLNLGWLQREFLGESWDLVDLSFDLYGNVVSNPGGAQATALSASVLVCTLNAVFCLGVGTDLLGANGGALTGGWQAKNNLYPVLSFSIPVEWAPTSPPIGVEEGARGLRRGATIDLGAP